MGSGCRTDEHDEPVFHGMQERVLWTSEPVDLVDEEHRALAAQLQALARLIDHGPDVLHAAETAESSRRTARHARDDRASVVLPVPAGQQDE
jgi:hypothetical protein